MGCLPHAEALLDPISARAMAFFERHVVRGVRAHAAPRFANYEKCAMMYVYLRRFIKFLHALANRHIRVAAQEPFPRVISAERTAWYDSYLSPGGKSVKIQISYDHEYNILRKVCRFYSKPLAPRHPSTSRVSWSFYYEMHADGAHVCRPSRSAGSTMKRRVPMRACFKGACYLTHPVLTSAFYAYRKGISGDLGRRRTRTRCLGAIAARA